MIYIYNMKYTLLESEKKHQKEYEIGRFLLRKGLKDLYGIELELDDLENFIIKNKYGKPSFKDIPKSRFDIELKKYNGIFFNHIVLYITFLSEIIRKIIYICINELYGIF